MEPFDIHLVPILIGAIIDVFLSALWFNAPFLFANPWLKAIQKPKDQVASDFSPLKIVYALITALLLSFGLSVLLQWAGISGLLPAAVLGALAGLSVAISRSSVRAVFEGRPLSLLLINAGHDMVTCTSVSTILALWL